MKEELSHNEFEKRLKDSADKFRLQPSDEVWKGIREELHPRRRIYIWWWTAAGVLLLIALGVYVLQPSGPVLQKQTAPMIANNPAPSAGTTRENAIPPSEGEKIHSKEKKNTSSVSAKRKETTLDSTSAADNQALHGAIVRKSHPVNYSGTNTSPVAAFTGQEKLSVLPVLPHQQPDFSMNFDADLANYKPVYPERVARNRSKGLVSFQPGNHLPAKKPTPTGLKKQIKKKPALEISFTPAIGYRFLKTSTAYNMMADANSMAAQSSFNTPSRSSSGQAGIRQHPDYGWAVSARLVLPLGKQWFLQSGLSLIKTGYSIQAYGTYPATVRNNGVTAFTTRGTNSFYTVSSTGNASLKSSHVHNYYLATELPVLFSRRFGNPDKISFSVGAGIGIFYLVKSEPVIYSPDSRRYFTDKDYIRPFNGNLHLETSINIPLNYKFQISLGPSFQYQIFSSYKNYPQVKEHPYLMGIKAGLELK